MAPGPCEEKHLSSARSPVHRVGFGSYFFGGNDLTGAEGVKYVLRVSGAVSSGTFPPEVGESATISYDAATMEVEAKGKGKSQSVCVGPVSISATVEFTGIN